MGSLRMNIELILDFVKAPTLFLVYDLPNDVICNIFIYADDTTLCFKFDQASDLW